MTPPTDARFLVAGAGIGGLATALALATRGHDVLVLESAAALGEIGAGIQLAPNALRVLDELGVLEDVYVNAVCPPRATMRDAVTGSTLTALDFGASFVERYGYPYIVTHRADLHESLLRSCKTTGRVTVLTGHGVTAISERDSSVAVETTGGSSYRGEILIGADGLRSVVRQYTVGDGSATAAGDVAFRATVPSDCIPDREGKDDMTWWVGPQMHLIQYPVRGGELINQVAVISPDAATADTRAATDREWGTPEDLQRLFADKYADVMAGVALVNTDPRWQLFDRAPTPTWTRGQVTLLGDAAHPMLQYLAQGGCQALEDAVALAACFDANPTSPGSALLAYERERAPRTAAVQTWARRIGEIVHADGTLALLRNALLRHRAEDDFTYVDWLYGYRFPAP